MITASPNAKIIPLLPPIAAPDEYQEHRHEYHEPDGFHCIHCCLFNLLMKNCPFLLL